MYCSKLHFFLHLRSKSQNASISVPLSQCRTTGCTAESTPGASVETEAYKRSSRAAAVRIKQLVLLNFNLYYKICSHIATQTGQHMLSILQTHAESKVPVPKKLMVRRCRGGGSSAKADGYLEGISCAQDVQQSAQELSREIPTKRAVTRRTHFFTFSHLRAVSELLGCRVFQCYPPNTGFSLP